MKQFFKFMFASMLGTVLVLIILFIISLGIVAGIVAATSSDEVVIDKNTILVFKMDKPVADRSPKMPVFGMFGTEKYLGLTDILKNLKKAKTDKNVPGIYLDLSSVQASMATVEEIREGLLDFKKSGKFIWAYSEGYDQKAYYLASTADKIYLTPQGMVFFTGLSTNMMFLKGTLEKLDIKVQVIRHGKFKAATEPLFLDKMSPENRKQTTELITDLWDTMIAGISESRHISRDELNLIADSLKLSRAAEALKYKFIDQIAYKDEFLKDLRSKLGLSEKAKIRTVSMDKYTDVEDHEKKSSSKDKIAVIYAQGSIGSGEGDDQDIGSDRISRTIRKAREDDKVKAIVFRINSGGGDGLASDIIWREVALAAKVKPVVASFGDVAASGGYYIACASTRIVAEPNTITGSIGVFGIIPNFEGLMKNKLGITFDEAKTNKNSGFISVQRPLTPFEYATIQREIETFYDTFISKVAEGRKLTKAQVDSIGQGRVWSGIDAKRIGLIDDFGGLNKAIEIAADLAKLKSYKLWALPEQKEPLQQIIDELFGNNPETRIQSVMGEDYKYYRILKDIRGMKGVQARCLYEFDIN
ncbi:MAG: signal peptide peptidase SppA [Bacteroidetes bacterium]|nr:signal peptide peptidase SppA [Bacteroidota bacterium]